MDYLGKKCPVCDKYFHADEDIVVCPDCGTPHHRACYEQENQCFYADRHKDGFDYTADTENDTSDNICHNCGTHNDKGSFYCKHCGVPMSSNDGFNQQTNPFSNRAGQNPNQGQTQNPQGSPFPYDIFDPLAGVNKDESFGDGITAGEAAKYVKQNTPYFIRIFNNIVKYSKSRFNFCAAIFMGVYLLYRKMYKIGALITALQLGLTALYVLISYSAPYEEIIMHLQDLNVYDMSYITEFINYTATLSPLQIFMVYYMFMFDLLRIAMMIVIGLTFNRLYFTHCKKQISKIKAGAASKQEAESLLQTKGGVNTAIAVTLMISFAAIVFLPFIINNFF